MALINRISRLFTADVHAVLDRIEEPETLLKQSLREMEEELATNERRVRWLVHELEQLVARNTELSRSLAKLEEELDVCFSAEEDDLARSLIRRKLQAEQLSKDLIAKIKATEKALETQRKNLEEKRRCLQETRQKAALWNRDLQSGSHRNEVVWNVHEPTIGEDEVEVAFLREKRIRSTA